MNEPLFKLRELVLYCDGLFYIRKIRECRLEPIIAYQYCIGKDADGMDFWVSEWQLKRADHRDQVRIITTRKI